MATGLAHPHHIPWGWGRKVKHRRVAETMLVLPLLVFVPVAVTALEVLRGVLPEPLGALVREIRVLVSWGIICRLIFAWRL